MIVNRAQLAPSVPTQPLKLHARLATSAPPSQAKKRAIRPSRAAKSPPMLRLIATQANTVREGPTSSKLAELHLLFQVLKLNITTLDLVSLPMQELLAQPELSVQWELPQQTSPHALRVHLAPQQVINANLTVLPVPRVISVQMELLRLAIVLRDLTVPSVPITKPLLLALLEPHQLPGRLQMLLPVLQQPV